GSSWGSPDTAVLIRGFWLIRVAGPINKAGTRAAFLCVAGITYPGRRGWSRRCTHWFWSDAVYRAGTRWPAHLPFPTADAAESTDAAAPVRRTSCLHDGCRNDGC